MNSKLKRITANIFLNILISKKINFFLLYLFFLDNFDLYRNFYKNLIKLYFIFTFFNFNERI